MAESRAKAQRLIMAGQVRADGQLVPKPATQLPAEADLAVDRGPRYVSRGGEKLAAALAAFPVHVDGRVCADVGASTGGFTDCLLQRGAARVYSVDVGRGVLHWKLRNDDRVVVLENSNARYLEELPETIELVTADVSFISLRLVLPAFAGWYGPEGGAAVTLIKPQFEAGREQAARGKGVIRDPAVHREVLVRVLEAAVEAGFQPRGLIRSPLRGPKGNVEFLAWLEIPAGGGPGVAELVAEAMEGD